MKEAGLMARPMAMESIKTKTVQPTRVNGSLTDSTAKELRFGLMAHSTRDLTSRARSTEKAAYSFGVQTVHATKDNLEITTLKVKAPMCGRMGALTTATGETIRCTERVYSAGPTAAAPTEERSIEANTGTTRSTAMEKSAGLMAACTPANGLSGSSTVPAATRAQKATP